MFSFVDIKTLYLIFHLIGLALGAGGAFMSDVLYMASVKDKKITKDELRLMHVGGSMVWVGLLVLTISGLLLMSLNWGAYLISTKFIAKMVIVLIIALNGAIIHHVYIPYLEKCIGTHLGRSTHFRTISVYLYISGAISFVSWIATIILGAFASIPYSVPVILGIYLAIVLIVTVVSLIVRHIFLRTR